MSLRVFLSLCVIYLTPISCSIDHSNAVKRAERLFAYVPSNLGSALSSPDKNPLTKQGVTLGRSLFYEPLLSGSNKLSCSSCHLQAVGFSDQLDLSNKGESGKRLLRHAPAIINLAWEKSFFWDGGSTDLESQAFGPLQSADEMGQDLVELVKELQSTYPYPKLFKDAFGEDSITSSNIVRALAQFQRTLISANSKYDKFKRNEAGGEMTSEELKGLALFSAKCASCHTPDFFTDHSFHNNGIDSSFSDRSQERIYIGRARITNNEADVGKFKTPTLRNIAITAPYMHDGRFSTLREVINHYSEGVKPSPTLDVTLKNENGYTGLKLTDNEKEDIISFLNTLTDHEFIINSNYSNPFKD